MANQQEIETTYDWWDNFHQLILGKNADYTCAFFGGDFSKTLNQAQKDKHEYILRGIGFKKGDKILDIGCGWGPMLRAIKEKGGEATGFTLSGAQQRSCEKQGLDVKLQDYKTADPKKLGKFDGIISIGALEHFCSIEEFKAGKQDEIYKNFFKFCYDLLPKGGRLYLHMMLWGKKVPDPDKLSLDAPKESAEFLVARTSIYFPGSWLPAGKDQLIKDAKPYFKFISSSNGRLDYIETLSRWGGASKRLMYTWRAFPAIPVIIKLLPRYIFSRSFRNQIAFLTQGDLSKIFKREIFTHERMFFEKV